MREAIQLLTTLRLRAYFALAVTSVLSFNLSQVQAQPNDGNPMEERALTDRSALKSLIDVLKNDAARSKLIEELEATTNKAVEQTATLSEPAMEAVSLDRRIAFITQEVKRGRCWRAQWALDQYIQRRKLFFSGLSAEEFRILLKAMPDLLLVIVITASVFLMLRNLAKIFYARLGRRAEQAGLFRLVSIFASNITALPIVLLVWALGYLVAILAVDEYCSIGIGQTMYLNAFLLVEIGKVVVRAVLFSPQKCWNYFQPAGYASTSTGNALSVLGHSKFSIPLNQRVGAAPPPSYAA